MMDGVARLIARPNDVALWGLWIGLAVVLVSSPGWSQTPSGGQAKPEPATASASGSFDVQALGPFFGEIIPRQLEAYHIPGAAVAVVKEGELVFAGGYGFADLELEKRVVADQTLFRTGSAAKLFVWTAIMQLAERGELDLHADVNRYLAGFQIPNTFDEPITLAHLLTHTAGFEDLSAGALRARPEDLEPLASYLAREIPARVYAPGLVTAYSNYGTALAGHIVEQVSGLPFERYVEERMLSPLGMGRTTFRQPVPAALADDLATGYLCAGGAFRPQPFEVFQIGVAGGASATVTDMARFMVAHLQEGRYGEARILGEQTSQLMRRQHFANDPRLTGMAYGFYEVRVNGRILLTHGGETSFFRTQLYLLPQEGVGLYVAYNAPGGGAARQELVQAFFDRFYPATPPTIPGPPSGATQRARQWEGRYISTRSARTTIEKLRLLYEPLFQPITVRATEDGYLETDHPSVRSQNPATYNKSRWVETEPNLYLQTSGRDLLAFRQDEGGSRMLFLDSVAPRGYRRLAWHEELMFRPALPLGLVLVLLGVLAFALFDRQALPAARWLGVGIGGVVVAFLLGLLAFAFVGFRAYLYGQLSPVWWAVFALPVILVILTIGLAIVTMLPRPHAGLIRRLPYALAVLAAAGTSWWLAYWNLLGWRF